MRQILLERDFPIETVRFFSSARSAGTVLPFGDREVTVEDSDTPTRAASTWRSSRPGRPRRGRSPRGSRVPA